MRFFLRNIHTNPCRKCARILVEQGANANIKNKLGQTPLHIACLRVHPGVSDLFYFDNERREFLHYFANCGLFKKKYPNSIGCEFSG